MASNFIGKVAIVGATGRIGKHFATALVGTGKHTVTALTREGSTGTLPVGVKSVKVDFDNQNSIVTALKGNQLLVITLGVRAPEDLHSKIVKAAADAGVSYVVPNIFGYDTADPASGDEAMYVMPAQQKTAEIKDAGLSYIVLSCGFWYQWSLALGEPWFGFDIKNKKCTFFDDGKTPINSSTWEQCGRALAALVSLPESGASPSISDWKNKYLYFDSFKVTQRDMLDSLNRAMGTTDKDWEISYEPSHERFEKAAAGIKKGEGLMPFVKGMYSRVFFPGGIGNTELKRGLANEALGLPKESLDEATKDAVQWVEKGWNPFAP